MEDIHTVQDSPILMDLDMTWAARRGNRWKLCEREYLCVSFVPRIYLTLEEVGNLQVLPMALDGPHPTGRRWSKHGSREREWHCRIMIWLRLGWGRREEAESGTCRYGEIGSSGVLTDVCLPCPHPLQGITLSSHLLDPILWPQSTWTSVPNGSSYWPTIARSVEKLLGRARA